MVAAEDAKLYEFFSICETSNIVLSLLTNLLLIWVIIKNSKELGTYRFLLHAFAINDIWFTAVHFLTLPVICSYRDAFIMFSTGILTSKFSICFFAATFSQTMPVMTHLFVYRLIVLKWPKVARLYTGPKTTILVLITVIIQNALWFANCWFNYDSDEELQTYLKPFLDADFPGEGQGHIGALYYNEEGLRLSAVMTTMGFNMIMFFWLAIISICIFLILRYFKTNYGKSSGGTNRTQRLQKQMFKTLMLQMAIPIMVVYLPCAGIINFPMFFRISVFPNFVSVAATFYPVADAVITMYCVKIFRQYLYNVLRIALRINIDQTTSLSGPPTR